MTAFTRIEPESSTRYLHDGTYFGFWSGHSVKMNDRDDLYEFHSELAVKGMNVPVTIHKSGDNFTMQDGHIASGRTTSYSHKFDDWPKRKPDGKECIRNVVLFDVQWSDCPIEVENEVKRLWINHELGNDTYFFRWDSKNNAADYPIIAAFLESRGVTECLINWWW